MKAIHCPTNAHAYITRSFQKSSRKKVKLKKKKLTREKQPKQKKSKKIKNREKKDKGKKEASFQPALIPASQRARSVSTWMAVK